MKKLLVLIVAIMCMIFATILNGQNDQFERKPTSIGNKAKYEIVGKKTPIRTHEYKLISPRKIKKSGRLSNQKMNEETFFTDSLKDVLMVKLKRKIELENGPKPKSNESDAQNIQPKASYEINIGAGSPPDNTLAVSENGFIVAADNNQIGFYDESGNTLDEFSYPDFLSEFDAGIGANTSDPKVVYDPEDDRFIFFIQSGSQSNVSFIILGFSSSDDPRDDWHFHSFTDHRDGERWFDYPSLAVNNTEVFVSGNLFDDEGDFQGNCIYQFGKDDGYAGSEVTVGLFWQDITPDWHIFPIGGLYAVPSATSTHYGPGIYLISTKSKGGGDVYLFEITDRHDSEPELRKYSINIDDYEVAPSAAQNGTAERLDAGDCRIKGAFYLRGRITFVFAKDDGHSFSGIAVTRIRIRDFFLIQKFFHNEQNGDYCYPSIAHRSQSRNNFKTLMVFLKSSNDVFPQVRMQTMRGRTLSRIGHSTRIQSGESFRDDGERGVARWGDYISVQRKYGTRTAWALAHTADENNLWRSHLIKIDL